MLYYIILYYTILYYTILYYIILYYIILYYIILYYIILYYIILYYIILYYNTFARKGSSRNTSIEQRVITGISKGKKCIKLRCKTRVPEIWVNA